MASLMLPIYSSEWAHGGKHSTWQQADDQWLIQSRRISGRAWEQRVSEGQKMGWAGAERWSNIPENAWAERGAGGRVDDDDVVYL